MWKVCSVCCEVTHNADAILDGDWLASMVAEDEVFVVDLAQAIAAQLQRVC